MTPEQSSTVEAYDRSARQYQFTIAALDNYNETYDALAELLHDGETIADLACGPANISRHLITKKKLSVIGIDLSDAMLELARSNVPQGFFFKSSIIDFTVDHTVDGVIIGFGLPYLDDGQMQRCLASSYAALKEDGLLYVSFMEGDGCGFETPSFNKNEKIFIYYHRRKHILEILHRLGFALLKTWVLEYHEDDGTSTIDTVIIARRH